MSPIALAVCLHDVEPETLERCLEIRCWLGERAIDRITLLAIPHGRSGPLQHHSECASWLRAQVAAGDAIAQHGMHHQRSRPATRLRGWIADRQGGNAAEFVGLTDAETAAKLDRGRRLLDDAGLPTRGFVAPAYAYTPALRRHLRRRFSWYGGLLAVHGLRQIAAPAHGLGTSTTFKRATSPSVLRISARLPTRILRIDLHPADFDLPGHVAALAAVLCQREDAIPMTYDQLTA